MDLFSKKGGEFMLILRIRAEPVVPVKAEQKGRHTSGRATATKSGGYAYS